MLDNFIEINSDWGKIGNFYWSNSITTPYRSLWFRHKVIFWGGYTFKYDDSKMIGKECYFKVQN